MEEGEWAKKVTSHRYGDENGNPSKHTPPSYRQRTKRPEGNPRQPKQLTQLKQQRLQQGSKKSPQTGSKHSYC